jgi:threonine synthase
VPTEMVKDFENLLEEGYKTAEKEHAARHAEYMANIMDIQNEKNYEKEMKDIEEDDFEWYQNGKRLNDDGEVSTSHKVKEKN